MKLSLKEFRDVVRSVLREAVPPAATPAAAAPAPGAPPPPPAAAAGAPPAPGAPAPQATPVIADLQAVMAAVTKALGSAQDPSTKQTLTNVNKTLQTLLQNVPK